MILRRAYWAIFVAALGVYGAMVLWTLPTISAEAGGLVPFDLRPRGYSPDQARAFVEALSARGREVYLGSQRLLDLAYPGLLALVLLGAVLTLVRGRGLRATLSVMIFIGMAADYAENFRIVEMLRVRGPLPDDLVAAASSLTVTKSVMDGIVMAAVVLALLVAALGRWRRR